MIVQNVSKEEREAGVKGAILGNVKYINKQVQQVKAVESDFSSDLPF
jgi:hypothetical protein